MKTKLKDQIQKDENATSTQISSNKNLQRSHGRAWEMSAQEALRVNYVTRNRSFFSES